MSYCNNIKFSDNKNYINGKNPNIVDNRSFVTRQILGDRLQLINYRYLKNFIATVYNNFIELTYNPKLKHTPDEIYRLLTSPNLVMYTMSRNNVMIGYIIGELMKLDDGRYTLFINYVYIGKKYRRNGLGSILLNKMITYGKYKGMDTIMLICDTENQSVLNFYLEKGFMYDQFLRRYDRYDVLSLTLE